MDFTLEALKRYLVMQLIETSSMQNSKDLMTDINQNAFETAKTMKGINDMFGRNNQPPPPQQQNNILNQPNPFLPPEQQQGFNQNFQQQPNFQQPNYQQQDEFFRFKNEMSMSITQIKNDMNALKAEIFNGLQGLNHALTQLCHNMGNNNQPQQQPQNNNQQQQNKGS